MPDLSLKQFTAIDRATDTQTYIAALEAFDGIEQLQELKALAWERSGLRPGMKVLDVGCGFGLETMRLAKLVGSTGTVAGIDKSADFIALAKQRAGAAEAPIDFRVAEAEALPFPDASFDNVRAERLLIYLKDWPRAATEMKRVARPGGTIAIIEPDFGTTTINLPQRDVVRRAMAHEADTAVVMNWLPGELLSELRRLGLSQIQVTTRVAIFPQGLGAEYFSDVGRNAHKDGALSDGELAGWRAGIADLAHQGNLFGTVGYFLLTAST